MTLNETMIRKNESEGIKEPIDLERNLITIPIDTDRHIHYTYKGPYGECATYEELREQQERWKRINLTYIGPDGQEYSSMAEVRKAEEEWFKQYKAGLR